MASVPFDIVPGSWRGEIGGGGISYFGQGFRPK